MRCIRDDGIYGDDGEEKAKVEVKVRDEGAKAMACMIGVLVLLSFWILI